MRTKITQTFNGRSEWPITGRYLELNSTVGNVDVELIGRNGNVIESAAGCTQGDFFDRRGAEVEEFVRIAIITPANEAVTFTATDGYSGSRAVPSNVSDRAARLLGIVYGNLGQLDQQAIGGRNVLPILNRGFTYGAAQKASSNLAANAAEAIFTAAANTAGAILWRAEAVSQAASAQVLTLQAHTAAPTASTTGDILALAGSATNTFNTLKLESPIYIAAGKGAYWLADAAMTYSLRGAIYTLL